MTREKAAHHDSITIVSGLPRSGTSMMMKMLEAGGLVPLTDNIRTPDDDNPKGYYEFERVKKLPDDTEWLPSAKGRVVKVISFLLKHLPSLYRYNIIFMLRDMDEILASQQKMLERRKKTDNGIPDSDMAASYRLHLDDVRSWLDKQHYISVLYVSYNEILRNSSRYSRQVNAFLGDTLDAGKMTAVVDAALYRQRN